MFEYLGIYHVSESCLHLVILSLSILLEISLLCGKLLYSVQSLPVGLGCGVLIDSTICRISQK